MPCGFACQCALGALLGRGEGCGKVFNNADAVGSPGIFPCGKWLNFPCASQPFVTRKTYC